jgi:HAD superfamily hydrolase (TIGR01509 family)
MHQMTWLKSKAVYPEVVEVLKYFKARGFRMGVISDTSPSLQLTLEAVGLNKYFTSFTASSLVGAGKPSPIIFNAALHAQNVSAAESLYVDDYDVEADGAREQGFTSFLIDRDNQHTGQWFIKSLKEMVDFVERQA